MMTNKTIKKNRPWVYLLTWKQLPAGANSAGDKAENETH